MRIWPIGRRRSAQLFLDRVAATPEREAFRYPVGGAWQSLTWAQTSDRAFQIAAGLIALGSRVRPAGRHRLGNANGLGASRFRHPVRGRGHHHCLSDYGGRRVRLHPGDSQSRVIFAENAAQVEKIAHADLPDLCAVVVFDPSGAESPSGKAMLTLDELSAKGRALLAEQSTAVTDRIAAVGAGGTRHPDLHLRNHGPPQGGSAGPRQLDLRGQSRRRPRSAASR